MSKKEDRQKLSKSVDRVIKALEDSNLVARSEFSKQEITQQQIELARIKANKSPKKAEKCGESAGTSGTVESAKARRLLEEAKEEKALTKPPAQMLSPIAHTPEWEKEQRKLRMRAHASVHKAILKIEGYEPMNDVDLVKAFGSINAIPDELKAADGRPPKDWWDKCIAKAESFADDPARYCGALWSKTEKAMEIEQREQKEEKAGKPWTAEQWEQMKESFGKAMDSEKCMSMEKSKEGSKSREKSEKGIGGALAGGAAGTGIGMLTGHPLAGGLIGAGIGGSGLLGNKAEKAEETEESEKTEKAAWLLPVLAGLGGYAAGRAAQKGDKVEKFNIGETLRKPGVAGGLIGAGVGALAGNPLAGAALGAGIDLARRKPAPSASPTPDTGSPEFQHSLEKSMAESFLEKCEDYAGRIRKEEGDTSEYLGRSVLKAFVDTINEFGGDEGIRNALIVKGVDLTGLGGIGEGVGKVADVAKPIAVAVAPAVGKVASAGASRMAERINPTQKAVAEPADNEGIVSKKEKPTGKASDPNKFKDEKIDKKPQDFGGESETHTSGSHLRTEDLKPAEKVVTP